MAYASYAHPRAVLFPVSSVQPFRGILSVFSRPAAACNPLFPPRRYFDRTWVLSMRDSKIVITNDMLHIREAVDSAPTYMPDKVCHPAARR